jgi:hypothetical protein
MSVSRFGRIAALGAAMLLCAAALATPAWATEAIESFQTTTSSTRAGGHPDLETSFSLASPGQPEAARDVTVNMPQGIFGNPRAVTQCTPLQLAIQACPTDSQVGIVTVRAYYESDPYRLLGTAPVYDMEPTNGETAEFAFITPVLNIPIKIPVTVRTGDDYGLRFTVSDITQVTPLGAAHITFWGFPAAAAHNPQRFPKGRLGEPAGCPVVEDTSCLGGSTASEIPIQPLTDNPSLCTGHELVTRLEVRTYQDLGHVSEARSTLPPTEECERQTFKPLLYGGPTTTATDSPSGLDVDLRSPQFLGPASSPSVLKSATVILPPGLTVNPDAADGQTACSDAEANFGSEGPARCPDQAKVGTISVHSLALSGAMEGSIYIGEPKPGDQYRIYMTVSGFGMNAKFVGSLRPNPQTGQVRVYFEGLPQVPFDDFQVHLFASDRGLFATPTSCTTYPLEAEFVPWNATLPTVRTGFNFGLETGPHGAGCPGQLRPFHPRLGAGTSNSRAGAHSAFTLKLDRDDGDQFLGKLNFTMPPGLSADLRGVTYCPEAAIAASASRLGRLEQALPSCPLSSQIGTTNVAAGPGSHPFHATGKIYLAGPFKGAPMSLVAVTPALAGPYDYGTEVVRVAIDVDPRDAHVIADSETVPSIIGGIPIRIRSIQVNVDKPNFMINPTNCRPLSVASQGIGDQGTVADFSSYFHVDNCGTMPFKPKLTVRELGSRRQARRGKDPRLRFDLYTRPGDANIRSMAVTLPKAFAVDQRHLGNICSKAELASKRCAGRQPMGLVETKTPLLDQPLKGVAYAVSGFGKLPHLAFILGGQVTIIPEAESSSVKKGHLKTVVPVVPDVPIGHFRLTLLSGKHGYLVNTRNLCASPARLTVQFDSQSGRSLKRRVTTRTPCAKRHKRHHARHRRRS